jgi:hypothetical protein
MKRSAGAKAVCHEGRVARSGSTPEVKTCRVKTFTEPDSSFITSAGLFCFYYHYFFIFLFFPFFVSFLFLTQMDAAA